MAITSCQFILHLPFSGQERDELRWCEKVAIGINEAVGIVFLWLRPNILVHVDGVEKRHDLEF